MAVVAATVAETIGRTVEGLGYEFVDAEWLAGGLLRVTIDRDGGIGLADCEKVSRQLTHLFAVEDVDYSRLEVSSPGLDRPLKRARDYRRFVGAEARVQLYAPLAVAAGRRRLRGRLLDVVGDSGAERVRMQLVADEESVGARATRGGRPGKQMGRKVETTGGATVEFALADVEKAKLVPELNFRRGAKE